jgi:hypothetical protein
MGLTSITSTSAKQRSPFPQTLVLRYSGFVPAPANNFEKAGGAILKTALASC